MSKGSKQRPKKVPRKTFEENWDRVFKTKQEKPKDDSKTSRPL